MRLAFDVTSCAKARRGGIATYGWALVQACARVAPQHDYVLAVRSNRWLSRRLLADMLPGVRPRLLVDGLHRLLLGAPLDALHGVGVRLPAVGGFARTVMLHDLNVFEFPELSSEEWRRTRQQRIRETVARATLVLSYSAQGRAALQHHVGLAPEKVRVVPLGVDVERFRRPPEDVLQRVLGAHGLLGRPYVLMIGEYSTRKNPHGLLEAFAAAGLPDEWMLVLGGPRDADREALAAHAARLGLPERRLHLPGWVADEELPALLAGAAFYVCSSLHEGFGLPVLEAQACGTPVLSSDRAALRETLGDCGLLFDPGERDDFVAGLRRMAADTALRQELSRRGPPRVAAHYGWDVVARATLAAIEEAVALRLKSENARAR